MQRRTLVLVLDVVVTMTSLCCAQDVMSAREDSASRSTLTDVLRKARFSGSLEYSGHCDTQEPPILPNVRTPLEGRDSFPLVMLREMFADNSKMQVTQQPDGMIRMVESNVPTDILAVKITRLSFKNVYDPIDAQAVILSASEVQVFLKAHSIRSHDDRSRFHEMRGIRTEPQPGLPHISEDLTNISVQQALDRLLSAFPGLWIYENCQTENGGREVAFGYLQRL